MQALISRIQENRKISRVALVVENSTSAEIIPAFLDNTNIVQIDIYSSEKSRGLDFRQRFIKEYKRKGIILPQITYFQYCFEKGIGDNGQKYDAVFFDSNVNHQTIMSLKAFSPINLWGIIWTDMVSYFDVWEYFRDISSNIHLQVISSTGKIETLDWHAAETSDVEISVVFPVYKVADYLPKCIESVTAWKAPYIEFIFVNDGSPDNSRDIILQYQKNDSRIKLVDKPNGGCASARKKGAESAQGKYIGFFDPDDFIHPEMYQKLLRRAMLGDYDICYCGYKEYYESDGSSRNVSDAILEPYIYGITQKDDIQKLIMYARVAIWRGIYKQSFLKRNNISFYEDLKRFDDLPFKIETFACATSVITLPENLYYYRLQRPGQDVACTDERLYVHFDIFKHLDQTIGAYRDQRLMDYLQVVKFQTHLYAYDKIDSKYARTYYKKMMADLKENMSFARTKSLIGHYLGRSKKREYLLLALHMPYMYKLYRNIVSGKELRQQKSLHKVEAQLRKLE